MSVATTGLELIKTALPFVGTALLGPLATGALSFVASKLGVPEESVTNTLTTMLGNPEELAKVKQIEADYKAHCLELGYSHIKDIETINASVVVETVKAVNTTMQAETTAEHWPTYSWRPFCGFILGTTFLGNYFILPLCKISSVSIPTEAWGTMAAILGVASYFRGKAQADPEIPPAVRLHRVPVSNEVVQSVTESVAPTAPTAAASTSAIQNASNITPVPTGTVIPKSEIGE